MPLSQYHLETKLLDVPFLCLLCVGNSGSEIGVYVDKVAQLINDSLDFNLLQLYPRGCGIRFN